MSVTKQMLHFWLANKGCFKFLGARFYYPNKLILNSFSVFQQALLTLSDDLVINKIYVIRGQKVMLDRDLAELYGIETRVLNQSVSRNERRFPPDFMFYMTEEELADWKSQIVISNKEKMGIRKPPRLFTEQGIAMLSSVLNSDTAIYVNIQIIRIFTRIRQMLTDNTEISLEIEKIKQKLDNQDKNIEIVFRYLDELLEKRNQPLPPRKAIGYEIGQNKK